MKQEIWNTLIAALPPDLTPVEVARIFRRSENLTRRRLLAVGYRFKVASSYEVPDWAREANWNLPNVDIARKFNISRERVRVYRNKLGHPFVEARGRVRHVKKSKRNSR
jgi:hypothetical protein